METERSLRPKLRTRFFLREIVETIVFIFVVYVLVELAAPRFLVEGPSMEPTFWTDQRLIISRVNYLVGEPERGDIVVFNSPGSRIGDAPLIKRLIGLPGETIEMKEKLLYINGVQIDEPYIKEVCTTRCQDKLWVLGANEYFVMGDNRNHSNDSRAFDQIQRSQIIGEALIRYWPPQDWAYLEKVRFLNP
jgi:signal peptidase I